MSVGLRVEAELTLPSFALRAQFCVPPGLSVLFGPSGAGKSLALQAIAGLMPLTSGRITLDGQVLADAARGSSLPPRLRRIGYVPQRYALFPHLTVAANVAYALPPTRHPWDAAGRASRDARVGKLLDLVRLPGFERRRPGELSGGQAQRVALARALAADPLALLLDEPLGALDAPTRAALQDDLRRVVVESGVPALVVTHDLAEARTLGDRLVVLVAGRVEAEGTVADVLAEPPTAEAALLLGWRNIVPLERVIVTAAGAEVTVPGGQRMLVPATDVAGAETGRALALRADALELAAVGTDHEEALLAGRVIRVTDQGPYLAVSVALEPGEQVPPVVVSCSSREWAALGVAAGDCVAVRVPEGAARLVACASREEGIHG